MSRREVVGLFAMFLVIVGVAAIGIQVGTYLWVTPLVARVQHAGAGGLRGVSREAMQVWLAQHLPVAADVSRDCTAIRARADVDWYESVEGRLCAAASDALAEPVSDHARKEQKSE